MREKNTFQNNTLGKTKLEKTTLRKTIHWENNGFIKEHIEKNHMFGKNQWVGEKTTQRDHNKLGTIH